MVQTPTRQLLKNIILLKIPSLNRLKDSGGALQFGDFVGVLVGDDGGGGDLVGDHAMLTAGVIRHHIHGSIWSTAESW